MTGLLYASAAALLAFAALAAIVYSRAVAHGHRRYAHVVLAAVMLSVLELAAIREAEGGWEAAILVANLLGIAAMVSLARRFQAPGRERPNEVTMVPLRNALVGYAILLLAGAAGLARVETDSADKREKIIRSSRESCERDNIVTAEISNDRLTLNGLIGAALTDPTLKPPRTAEEDRFVRVFTKAQDELVPIEPENCEELFPIP